MAAEPQRALAGSSETIQIVSFASEACCRSLTQAVERLNFAIQTVAGEYWLSSRNPRPVDTIFLLGDRLPDGPRVSACIARSSGRQLLALASKDIVRRMPELADHCHDLIGWPCDDFEFAYRMDRLFRHGRSVPAPGGHDRLEEKLAELGMIGGSLAFLNAMRDLIEFAACDVPILLKGETGTGKELAARAVHAYSDRAKRPFVSINCGALPDSLVENELFGHERGAFTDAKEAQPGLVGQADGGTLFLDEVDTLSPLAQVALLRFLETREYRPLGGKEMRIADVRLVAATNANLEELVRKGRFRQDLLFRLDVCGVVMPPLRERDGDVERLTDHFLERYATRYRRVQKTVHPSMIEWMREAPWKGNVRELDNMLHRLVLLTKSRLVFVPEPSPGQSANGYGSTRGIPWHKKTYKDAKNDALESFERSYLTWLMAQAEGNLSLAARRTNLQRSSLRRLLQKHGIDKNAWKADST
jgi:DNA-binding NtrC family response regulator